MPRPKKSSYTPDKPPYSYVALCAMAIHSSPTKTMTLSQIYEYITTNFPFYKNNGTKWQNSLRHNLSFNDCFVKIVKDPSKGDKGSYWTVHESSLKMFEEGSLLRRKRRFIDKDNSSLKSTELHEGQEASSSSHHDNSFISKKTSLKNQQNIASDENTDIADENKKEIETKYPFCSKDESSEKHYKNVLNGEYKVNVNTSDTVRNSTRHSNSKKRTYTAFTIASILNDNEMEK